MNERNTEKFDYNGLVSFSQNQKAPSNGIHFRSKGFSVLTPNLACIVGKADGCPLIKFVDRLLNHSAPFHEGLGLVANGADIL